MKLVLNKTVALIGMMGAGKTAVGKAISARLHAPFIDSDSEIERAANMSIAEIFERDGEAFFREKESQIIKRLIEGEKCILSTGGGAFLAEHNRRLIHEKGASVWLNAGLDVLWGRVKNNPSRPLLQTENPFQALSKLYSERKSIYALADLSVESGAQISVDDMADKVILNLLNRPDILERQDG